MVPRVVTMVLRVVTVKLFKFGVWWGVPFACLINLGLK